MRQSIVRGLLALSLGLTLGAAQARNVEMTQPQRIEFGAGAEKALSTKEVRQAILNAAAKRSWQIRNDAAGKITLFYSKGGKHDATLDVLYDAKGYQITYVASTNLDYVVKDSQPRIHPTYNLWVNNLSADISNALVMQR